MNNVLNQARLHSLYAYAIAGGYGAFHDNEMKMTRMSAYMGMANIMPYHTQDLMRNIERISVADVAAELSKQWLSTITISKASFTLPKTDDTTCLMMQILWSGVFGDLQYWPEYLRSPFGTGSPSLTLQENKKIKHTMSKISSFFGHSAITVWRDSWTFPVPEHGANLLVQNYDKSANLVMCSNSENFATAFEFEDFLYTMTEFMKEIGDYYWLPIEWPTLLVSAPISKDNTLYPIADEIDQTKMKQVLGIQTAVIDAIQSIDDVISTLYQRTHATDSIERLKEVLDEVLGVNSPDVTKNPDDPNRYAVVNSGISLLKTVVQSYAYHQHIA